MKKRLIIILSVLILVSCINEKKESFVTTTKFIIRSEMKDIKNIFVHSRLEGKPEKIVYGEWISYIDDVDHFIISYPANYPKENPIFMSEMSIERMNNSTMCSPSLTGVTNPIKKVIDGIKIQTGKVDYLDTWDTYDLSPHPLCMPADIKYVPNADISIESYSPAYALCSEKNGNTVLICIKQIVDNSQLAEEIFKTFRWIGE